MSSFQKAIKNRGIFPRQLSTLDNRRVIWQGKSYLHLHFPNNFQHERCLKTVPQGFSVRFSMVACRVTTNQTSARLLKEYIFCENLKGALTPKLPNNNLNTPKWKKGSERNARRRRKKRRIVLKRVARIEWWVDFSLVKDFYLREVVVKFNVKFSRICGLTSWTV